jgi:membrane protein DedA with SNARE-associated domain
MLGWLSGLPAAVLYLVMALAAAAENVFPPLPTDMVVAFGSWIAARGSGSALGAFLTAWLGNVAGAAGMYVVGRRHGAGWLRRHFPVMANAENEARLRAMYARYGVLALVVSRFLPGVRALVPPFAGALRLPAAAAIGATAVASAVWYGAISYLAFTAGADWAVVSRAIARSGRVAAIAAAVVVAAIALIVLLRRRRRAR